MSRSVHVRGVRLDDAPELLEIWKSVQSRLAKADEPLADVQAAIRKILASDRERIVLAECDGRIVGGIHLRIAPLAPMTTGLGVHASHLNVIPGFRRRGVARSLMEAAVSWAEENAIGHIVTLAAANSRETSRFYARLGLAPAAILRVATTTSLRGRLPIEMHGVSRAAVGNRHLSQVLAQRRSMRRSQIMG